MFLDVHVNVSVGRGRPDKARRDLSHSGAGRRQMSMDTEWDVIVVGAGLAGLSTAATAAQRGARVVVMR